jgi:hypothetical protein
VTDEYIEQPVMMKTTAPSPELSNCVLLVEREISEGTYAPHGTAFLLAIGNLRYAVTARHVVQELTQAGWGSFYSGLHLRAVSADANAPPMSIRKTLESVWFNSTNMFLFHPDTSVDAAVFPTYSLIGKAERSRALPLQMLQKDELVLPGEDVHLFGFPASYGSRDGTPVIRGGTIAYKLSRYEYLIDVTSWHGDSGGLVCSKPYFGVSVGQPGTYQWQIGGKVIGILCRYDPARAHGLPAELENFRVITAAQAVIEILGTPSFEALHAHLNALAERETAGTTA